MFKTVRKTGVGKLQFSIDKRDSAEYVIPLSRTIGDRLMKSHCLSLRCAGVLVAFVALAAFAAATPINLLREEHFTPLRMHDRDSAAKGWGLNDPRRIGMRRTGLYVPGEECFNLEFGPEGMTMGMLCQSNHSPSGPPAQDLG